MRDQINDVYRSCHYYSYLESFQYRLSKLISDAGMENLDSSHIVSHMAETLEQLYLPDFVSSFEHWREKTSSCEKYLLKAQNDVWTAHIKSSGPFLEKLAKDICSRALACLTTFLFHFRSEYSLLRQTFGVPEMTSLGSLEILGDDFHFSSFQCVLIKLGTHRLVYKTWDSGIEQVINKICIIIGMQPLCPVTLNRKTHLWQWHIANRPLSSKRVAPHIYRQYGHILAMIEQLNIRDNSFDHFICDKNSVYFVSPENSLQFIFDDSSDLNCALIRSGLLSGTLPDTTIFSPGTIQSATANIFSATRVPSVVTERKKKDNYPHCCDRRLNFSCFTDEVVSGYEDGHARLRQHRWRILDTLEENPQLKPRFLIRNNSDYLSSMHEIIHSYTRRRVRGCCKGGVRQRMSPEELNYPLSELKTYEKKCFSRYEAPFYFINIHSRSLFTADRDEFPDFFLQSPMEQIRANFYRSAGHAKYQGQLIAEALNYCV